VILENRKVLGFFEILDLMRLKASCSLKSEQDVVKGILCDIL